MASCIMHAKVTEFQLDFLINTNNFAQKSSLITILEGNSLGFRCCGTDSDLDPARSCLIIPWFRVLGILQLDEGSFAADFFKQHSWRSRIGPMDALSKVMLVWS